MSGYPDYHRHGRAQDIPRNLRRDRIRRWWRDEIDASKARTWAVIYLSVIGFWGLVGYGIWRALR